MTKVLICDVPLYIRYRLKWVSNECYTNDLIIMIQSLIDLNISKDKIFVRLVDSYNYSVGERNFESSHFINAVKEFYDIKEFKRLANKRNVKSIYIKK